MATPPNNDVMELFRQMNEDAKVSVSEMAEKATKGIDNYIRATSQEERNTVVSNAKTEIQSLYREIDELKQYRMDHLSELSLAQQHEVDREIALREKEAKNEEKRLLKQTKIARRNLDRRFKDVVSETNQEYDLSTKQQEWMDKLARAIQTKDKNLFLQTCSEKEEFMQGHGQKIMELTDLIQKHGHEVDQETLKGWKDTLKQMRQASHDIIGPINSNIDEIRDHFSDVMDQMEDRAENSARLISSYFERIRNTLADLNLSEISGSVAQDEESFAKTIRKMRREFGLTKEEQEEMLKSAKELADATNNNRDVTTIIQTQDKVMEAGITNKKTAEAYRDQITSIELATTVDLSENKELLKMARTLGDETGQSLKNVGDTIETLKEAGKLNNITIKQVSDGMNAASVGFAKLANGDINKYNQMMTELGASMAALSDQNINGDAISKILGEIAKGDTSIFSQYGISGGGEIQNLLAQGKTADAANLLVKNMAANKNLMSNIDQGFLDKFGLDKEDIPALQKLNADQFNATLQGNLKTLEGREGAVDNFNQNNNAEGLFTRLINSIKDSSPMLAVREFFDDVTLGDLYKVMLIIEGTLALMLKENTMQNLRENFTGLRNGLVGLGRSVMTGATMTGQIVSDAFNIFRTQGFSAMANSIGGALGGLLGGNGVLGGKFTMLSQVITDAFNIFRTQGFSAMANSIGGALSGLLSGNGVLGGKFTMLSQVITDAFNIFKTQGFSAMVGAIKGALGGLFGGDGILGIVKKIPRLFGKVFLPLYSAFEFITGFFEGFKGDNIIDKIQSGIATGLGNLIEGLTFGLLDGKAITEGLKSLFDNPISRAIKNAIFGIIDILKSGFDLVSSVFHAVVDPIVAIAKGIWNVVSSVFSTIVSVGETIFSLLSPLSWFFGGEGENASIFKTIANAISWLADGISSMTDGIVSVITSVFDFIAHPIDTLSSWFEEADFSIITDAVDSVVGVFSRIKQSIIDTVTPIIMPIVDTISTIFDAIMHPIDTLSGILGEVDFSSLTDAFKPIFDVFNELKQTFVDAFQPFADAFSEIKQAFMDIFQPFQDAFESFSSMFESDDEDSPGGALITISSVIKGVATILTPFIKLAAGALKIILTPITWVAEGIKRIGLLVKDIAHFVAHPIDSTFGEDSIISRGYNFFFGDDEEKKNPTPQPIPQHAEGLSYVPSDNYIASLHEGEAVLTANQADFLRSSVASDGGIPVELLSNLGVSQNEESTDPLSEIVTILSEIRDILLGDSFSLSGEAMTNSLMGAVAGFAVGGPVGALAGGMAGYALSSEESNLFPVYEGNITPELAQTQGYGKIEGSFDKGGTVPKDMTAQVHKGEVVIPADLVERGGPMAGIALMAANRLRNQYNINVPPSLLLTQMLHETGGYANYQAATEKYVLPKIGQDDHNYGGFTWYEGMGEEFKGVARPSNEGGYYAKFDSDEQYAAFWVDKVLKNYDINGITNTADYAAAMKAGGYYTGTQEDYTNSMNGIYSSYSDSMSQLDQMADDPSIIGQLKSFDFSGAAKNVGNKIMSSSPVQAISGGISSLIGSIGSLFSPSIASAATPQSAGAYGAAGISSLGSSASISGGSGGDSGMGAAVAGNTAITNKILGNYARGFGRYASNSMKVEGKQAGQVVQGFGNVMQGSTKALIGAIGNAGGIGNQGQGGGGFGFGKNPVGAGGAGVKPSNGALPVALTPSSMSDFIMGQQTLSNNCTVTAIKAMAKYYKGTDYDVGEDDFSSAWSVLDNQLNAEERHYGDLASFKADLEGLFQIGQTRPIALYQTGGAGSSGDHALNRGGGSHMTVITKRTEKGTYLVSDSNGGIVHELTAEQIYDSTAQGGTNGMPVGAGNALFIPRSAALGEWSVPHDNALYYLHAGELVAPPELANQIRTILGTPDGQGQNQENGILPPNTPMLETADELKNIINLPNMLKDSLLSMKNPLDAILNPTGIMDSMNSIHQNIMDSIRNPTGIMGKMNPIQKQTDIFSNLFTKESPISQAIDGIGNFLGGIFGFRKKAEDKVQEVNKEAEKSVQEISDAIEDGTFKGFSKNDVDYLKNQGFDDEAVKKMLLESDKYKDRMQETQDGLNKVATEVQDKAIEGIKNASSEQEKQIQEAKPIQEINKVGQEIPVAVDAATQTSSTEALPVKETQASSSQTVQDVASVSPPSPAVQQVQAQSELSSGSSVVDAIRWAVSRIESKTDQVISAINGQGGQKGMQPGTTTTNNYNVAQNLAQSVLDVAFRF